MRLITQTTELIVATINDFWKDFLDGELVKSNDITVTAEDLPMICMYVFLQTGMSDLYAHLKMINQFSTNHLRQNKLGYNASTFEMCLEVLLEFTTDQVSPAGVAVDQMDTFEMLHPLQASMMEDELVDLMKNKPDTNEILPFKDLLEE
jgi:hypothetical protein